MKQTNLIYLALFIYVLCLVFGFYFPEFGKIIRLSKRLALDENLLNKKNLIKARVLNIKDSRDDRSYGLLKILQINKEKGDFGKIFLILKNIEKDIMIYDELELFIKLFPNKYKGRFKAEYVAFLYYDGLITNINQGPFPMALSSKSLSKTALKLDDSGVTSAFLSGNSRFIKDKVFDILKRAGIYHLFVISGFHIGILAFILLRIFKLPLLILHRNKKIFNSYLFFYPYLISLILIFYLATISFAQAASRAVIFSLFYFVSLSFKRKTNIKLVLAQSALVILFVNPESLFSVSFQLTFAAVISIIYLGIPLIKKLAKKQKYFIKKIFEIILVSLAAWLGIMPFVLFYFKSVSLIFLLSNLFIGPIISFIVVPLNFFAQLVYYFSEDISFELIKLNVFFIRLSIYFAEMLIRLPFSYVQL
ncbi:MAG: ComEC/Rec2 family competence protein [Pseudomonadota bacterium]